MYKQTSNNNFQNNVNPEDIFSKHERDKDPSSVLGCQKIDEHGNSKGHPNVVVRPEARYKGYSKPQGGVEPILNHAMQTPEQGRDNNDYEKNSQLQYNTQLAVNKVLAEAQAQAMNKPPTLYRENN